MIIFIAGHSYLGKLAAGFPNVMLQIQDPNHTLHYATVNAFGHGSWVTNQEIWKSQKIFFLSKIQQLNQPGAWSP